MCVCRVGGDSCVCFFTRVQSCIAETFFFVRHLNGEDGLSRELRGYSFTYNQVRVTESTKLYHETRLPQYTNRDLDI